MTKKTCEKRILNLMKEIAQTIMEYEPNTHMLSLCYISDDSYITFNNSYTNSCYDNNKDLDPKDFKHIDDYYFGVDIYDKNKTEIPG